VSMFMTISLRATACALLFGGCAMAQVPAVERPSIEKASHALDELIKQIESARTEAFEAKRRAAVAETDQQRAALATLVEALSDRLQSLAAEFARATGTVRAEIDPLRAELDIALRLDTLENAQDALKKIEARELKQKPKGELVGLIHFSLASTMRLRAEQMIKTSRNSSGAQMLLIATLNKYRKALRADDLADPKIGSSVRAVALRHIVQIEASLFDGYRELYRRKASTNTATRMKKHHKAGIQAVDDLRRRFPDATLADGARIVDAIKGDVFRLTKR